MSPSSARGEGAGSDLLTHQTRAALVDAYIESFPTTPLVMLLSDEKPISTDLESQRRLAGGLSRRYGRLQQLKWSQHAGLLPQGIVNFGMQDAWMKAPVSFEVCWVMQHWKNKGWDVDYIIDQSLKWHISSFNGKSSAVPEEGVPSVNRWLKKMGYRFQLRKFTYPAEVRPNGKVPFTTWWENKGVAPCYKPFVLRCACAAQRPVLDTAADIRKWLPAITSTTMPWSYHSMPLPETTTWRSPCSTPQRANRRSSSRSKAGVRTAGIRWERSKSGLAPSDSARALLALCPGLLRRRS
jgi:hypothetical protein